MTEILSHYEPITLDEMNDIRLMNRIDTKFVTTVPVLKRLLDMARDDYFVQETGGLRISPYYTMYFDTDDCGSMSNKPCALQLIEEYERYNQLLVSIHPIPLAEVSHYGILSGVWEDKERTILNVSVMQEKPKASYAEEHRR